MEEEKQKTGIQKLLASLKKAKKPLGSEFSGNKLVPPRGKFVQLGKELRPSFQQRKFTPLQRQRLQSLQDKIQIRTPEGMNTDMRGVVASHDEQRERILQESSIRNQQLSPNTKLMLDRVRRIQTMGQRADDRQQRIQRERKIIQNATDVLRTPSLFDSKNQRGKLDFTGVDGDNILKSPNVFKENPENNILKTTRKTILDLGENTLKF